MEKTEASTVVLPELESARDIYVLHPLDDVPEEKCSPEGLGPMRMSGSRRLALLSLRGYLILMTLLVLFKAMSLAGFLGLRG